MTGFEPSTSRHRSNCTVNHSATTTVPLNSILRQKMLDVGILCCGQGHQIIMDDAIQPLPQFIVKRLNKDENINVSVTTTCISVKTIRYARRFVHSIFATKVAYRLTLKIMTRFKVERFKRTFSLQFSASLKDNIFYKKLHRFLTYFNLFPFQTELSSGKGKSWRLF